MQRCMTLLATPVAGWSAELGGGELQEAPELLAVQRAVLVLVKLPQDLRPLLRREHAAEAYLAGGLGVYTRRSGFATRDLGRNRRDIGH